MIDPNSVFTDLRYIPPTQNELMALLAQKDELQSKLDSMTIALELMVRQYNGAIDLLEASTSVFEGITEMSLGDVQ